MISQLSLVLLLPYIALAAPNPQDGPAPQPTPSPSQVPAPVEGPNPPVPGGDPGNPLGPARPLSPPTSTVSIAGSPSGAPTSPPDLDGNEPIDINKYFYVDDVCSDKSKRFYQRAYEGAVAIANSARKWPSYGLDASDLYFGNGTEKFDKVKDEIPANLDRAAGWNKPAFGFDDYIVLSCPMEDTSRSNRCKEKVGKETKVPICYVETERNWFWDKDTVYCCDPFFSLGHLGPRVKQYKGATELDARNLVTSGSALLHEMMHARRVTLTRRPILDQVFDGGVKIYGPNLVAKAARVLGPDITGLNADSYATFANAIYFKDRIGVLPQPKLPSTSSDVPDDLPYTDDADADHEVLVRPSAAGLLAATPSYDPSPAETAINKLATPLPADEEPDFDIPADGS